MAEEFSLEIDAEEAFLGAIFNGPNAVDMDDLMRTLKGVEFRSIAAEAIWEAICKTYLAGEEPTIHMVRDRLSAGDVRVSARQQQAAPFGSIQSRDLTLVRVLEKGAGVTSHLAPVYAERIVAESLRRQLAGIETMLAQGRRDEMNPEDLRLLAIDRLEQLERREAAEQHLSPRASLPEVIEVAEHGVTGAIPTKWSDLNDVIHGWFPGQLIVIGARPGVGKSIMGENSATDCALKHSRPCYVASMEMSSFELTQRTVANLGEVPLQGLRTATLDERSWNKVAQISGLVTDLDVWHADAPNQSLADIRAGVKAMKRKHPNLGLVIVDYLQLMRASDPKLSRQVQIGEFTRGLKIMAREFGVAVIALSQLRRPANENTLPTMSDLRESGDIEQDADVIILLHREDRESAELLALVEKQRSGPTGARVTLLARGHYARIDQAWQEFPRSVA